MRFKHQLPASPPTGGRPGASPVLTASVVSAGKGATAAVVVAQATPTRLLLYRWDRCLASIQAPAPVTAAAFADGDPFALLLGCADGSTYRVPLEDLVRSKRRPGPPSLPAAVIEVEAGHRLGAAGASSIGGGRHVLALLPLASRQAGAGAAGQQHEVVTLAEQREHEQQQQQQQQQQHGGPASHGLVIQRISAAAEMEGKEQRHVLSSLGPATAAAAIDGGSDALRILAVAAGEPDGGQRRPPPGVHFLRCDRGKTEDGPVLMTLPFASQVVALLPIGQRGGEDPAADVVAVEREGRLARLEGTGQGDGDGSREWREAAAAALPFKDVDAAVLLAKNGGAPTIACLAAGRIWAAPLATVFGKGGGYRWAQLDCAPDVVALAAPPCREGPGVLFALTRRGRLMCLDVVPPRPVPMTAATFEAEEAAVRAFEAAARRTRRRRADLAAAEAALERLQSAWAVVAGRGLLTASLDLEHGGQSQEEGSGHGSGPPRLWARLQNPVDSEPLPLAGWSLLLRIEPTTPAALPGEGGGGGGPTAGSLLSLLGQEEKDGQGGGMLAGGSWPLEDLGPGERFQASLPLPPAILTRGPLPLTARLALCLPFAQAAARAGDEDLGASSASSSSWPEGICLELGSRPLDLLDLASPARTVPATPSELRAVEAAATVAAGSGRGEVDWPGVLAGLLLRGEATAAAAGQADEDSDEEEDHAACSPAGGAATALTRPLLSSALRLLWPLPPPAAPDDDAAEAEAAVPAALPSLADLLGACDGATLAANGRALALLGTDGRVLLARLLGTGADADGGEATLIMEEGAPPAVGLQVGLSATDRGLLALLRAACCQRLGPGAAIRTRCLPLTATRMRVLERAHREATALAEAFAASADAAGEGHDLAGAMKLAQRVLEVAVALGKEVDDAFLLDLRPVAPDEEGGMQVVGLDGEEDEGGPE